MGRWMRDGRIAGPVLMFGAAGTIWLVIYVLGLVPDFIIYTRFSLGYALITLLVLAGAAWGLVQWWTFRLANEMDKNLSALETAAGERRRRFLRRLDHELKNPLTTLQVDGAALEATGAGDPASRAPAGRVRAQAARLAELTSQLRKLADLETVTLEQAPVDMGALLEDLVTDLKSSPDGAARQISLSLAALPWKLPPVMGDADLLYLAFDNLIGNAVKFTPPGGTIEVRASEDGQAVTVSIADTGPGIPAEEVEQVWEELFRGRGAAGLPGSGLGLAMVKTVIERHAGKVSLRSRPGEGTVVTASLPLKSS